MYIRYNIIINNNIIQVKLINTRYYDHRLSSAKIFSQLHAFNVSRLYENVRLLYTIDHIPYIESNKKIT